MPEQDDAQNTADETVTASETADQTQTDSKDDEDRKGGQKALLADVARLRDRAQAAEKKLQGLEDAKLTELDRAKKEADSLRKELEDARIDVLRNRIAVKYGIPDEDVELFLTASDEERLTKQAERLAVRLKSDAEKPPTKRTPAPDRSQGARSGDGAGSGTEGLAEAQKRYGRPA